MANSTFIAEHSHPLTGSSRDASILWTPTESQWDSYEPTILNLYSQCQQNLPSVIKQMRNRYGFNATIDQYKHHIHRKWKVSGKNHTEDEMRAMALITAIRAKSGKESHFRLRGKYITPSEVRRYWQRKKMTIAHAAVTTLHVPYPRGLECIPVTEMNISPSAPKSFSQVEQLFWHSRKFAASWDGQSTTKYCDPDLSKFVRFFASSLHKNLIAQNTALTKACLVMQNNQSNFAWTFAFLCSAMSDFETPGFVQLLDQVVSKTPVRYPQTRKILQDLNLYEPQTAKLIACRVVDMCIQTVMENIAPLDARCFGLAISYAWLTEDFKRLRSIMQSYENCMKTNDEREDLSTTTIFQLATSNRVIGEHETAYRLFVQLLRSGRATEVSMYMFPEIFTYVSTSELAWSETSHEHVPLYLFSALARRVCWEFSFMQSAEGVLMVRNHTEDLVGQGLAVKSRLMDVFDGDAFRQAYISLAEIFTAIEDNNVDPEGYLILSSTSREWFKKLREWTVRDSPEVASKLIMRQPAGVETIHLDAIS